MENYDLSAYLWWIIAQIIAIFQAERLAQAHPETEAGKCKNKIRQAIRQFIIVYKASRLQKIVIHY